MLRQALTDNPSFIGLLDVFGFESFARNGFEQFLINYCNEVLQNQFNGFIFELEQQEYEKEQIEWSFVSFPDNKACIAMIEGRPLGLLSLLDESTNFPNATDDTLNAKLHEHLGGIGGGSGGGSSSSSSNNNNSRSAGAGAGAGAGGGGHEHFVSTRENRASGAFAVKHYAGLVRYETRGFLSKNRDKLSPEALRLLSESSRPFVRHLSLVLATSNKQPTLAQQQQQQQQSRSLSPPPGGADRAAG